MDWIENLKRDYFVKLYHDGVSWTMVLQDHDKKVRPKLLEANTLKALKMKVASEIVING